jgi:hypothetical protein
MTPTQDDGYARLSLQELVAQLPRNRLQFIAGVGDEGGASVVSLPQLGPLVLIGQAGIGKSHLLQAILAQLLATNDQQHLQVLLLNSPATNWQTFRRFPQLRLAPPEAEQAASPTSPERAFPGQLATGTRPPYFLVVAEEMPYLREVERHWEGLQALVQGGQALGVGVIAVAQSLPSRRQFPFESAALFAGDALRNNQLPDFFDRGLLRQVSHAQERGRFFLASLNKEVRIRDLPACFGQVLAAPYITPEHVAELLATGR